LIIDPGQHKDKSDYYHSFKSWLRGQPGARPRLRFKRVNWGWSSQCKDKNYYYCSFKTKLENQLEQGPGHKLEGSTWVDSRQCMNKNDYYHSFQIRLGSRPETRFRSWVGRVNSIDPKFLFFFKNIQWVFDLCFIPSWPEFLTWSSLVNTFSIFS
jgi:hypothetical protein